MVEGLGGPRRPASGTKALNGALIKFRTVYDYCCCFEIFGDSDYGYSLIIMWGAAVSTLVYCYIGFEGLRPSGLNITYTICKKNVKIRYICH